MRFIIFVSVLICLFTIVLFKRFEKKTLSFGLRYLYDLVAFLFAFILMYIFQLAFLGEAVVVSSQKIVNDYLLKLGVFFFIAYKFLNYKKKHEILGEKVSAFHYVIATLSFIPLIGILLGIIATVFGFFTKKKGGGIVAVIGISGIVFMFFLKDFGYLKVMDQSKATAIMNALEQNDVIPNGSGVIKPLNPNEATAVIELNYTVEFLEAFKEKTGNYPTFIGNNNKALTYYEVVGSEHYYLLSPGKDKIPFTADDIIPSIKFNMKKKTGLMIKPIKKNL
jgi:hypothetical protein